MYHAVLLALLFASCTVGHGYLAYPPARESMWRKGFNTPKNNNDMALNCGEISVTTGVVPMKAVACAKESEIAILPDCGSVPITTDSVTDITNVPVTGAPTTKPATRCQAVGKWAGLAYMDAWCTFNCLHHAIDFCPAKRCLCGSGQ